MTILASAPVLFHQKWATVVLVYSALMALWGLGMFLLKRNPSGGYLGALVIEEIIILVQAVAGIVLLGIGKRPEDPLHFLYGAVLILTLPFAYTLSARGAERRDSLIFGLAALFLVGISFRAFATGGS